MMNIRKGDQKGRRTTYSIGRMFSCKSKLSKLMTSFSNLTLFLIKVRKFLATEFAIKEEPSQLVAPPLSLTSLRLA
jgi:hypothetical protein